MSAATGNHHRTRNRVSNACQRCRKHKIRCSGTHPCQTCVHKGCVCEYAADDRKILISEGTLRDLQNKSRELEQLRKRKANQALARTSIQSDQQIPLPELVSSEPQEGQHYQDAPSVIQPNLDELDRLTDDSNSRQDEGTTSLSNPLVPERPEYVTDSIGALRYLGTSSNWSFCHQLLYKSYRNPNFAPQAEPALYWEGTVYAVDAGRPALAAEDFVGLPSLELAIFYVQTVKFRTYPLYYLFDEDSFCSNLRNFYAGMIEYAQQHRAWFAHYLVIMAFGKTFNTRTNSVTAGLTLFNRGLRILPDITILCHEPMVSTELLCSIALYLQSVDFRGAAHLYIGQALRMGQSHGLHTGMQADAVATHHANRGCRVWWTVYTLDRRLGSSFGVPSGFRDEDMTTPLPSSIDASETAAGQDIHVKICRVLGRVITTVYSSEEAFKKAFLSTVQEVLRGAGSLIGELARFSDSSAGEISHVAAHVNLSYHQCIILASRPFLFHLLSRRLESSYSSQNLRLSSTVKGILQVCIDSAIQSIAILTQLQKHDLLDVFLPFDLENAVSAGLVLVIAAALCPNLLPQDDWLVACYKIFDYMEGSGNVVAGMRKTEIKRMAEIALETQKPISHQNETIRTTTIQSNIADLPSHTCSTPAAASSTNEHQPSLGSVDPFFEDWFTDVGFSETQMMELANSLTSQDMMF